METLTKCELEVLELVTKGLKDKEIAEHLQITPKTVHNHLRYI
jgi:DNA-binding NarL/FixJ family response regulator